MIDSKKKQVEEGLTKSYIAEVKDDIKEIDEREAKLARDAQLCLVGTFISQLIVGSSISISDMQSDIVSYFEDLLPDEDATYLDTVTSWIAPCFIVISAGFFPIGVYAVKAKTMGPRVVIGMAGVILISNMILSSWSKELPTLFVVFFTVGLGISQGLIYSANLISAWSHYPQRKGLATGINSSALVLGQFIYNVWTAPSSTECSSDDTDCSDIYDTSSVWDTDLMAFINTSCWIWVVQLAITIMLVKLKEEDKDLEQEEAEKRGSLHMNDAQKQVAAKKKIPKSAHLWHRDFWKLVGIACGEYYAYCIISSYYTEMAVDMFDSDTLTLYGNIATVCQAVWLFAQAWYIDFIDVQQYFVYVMYAQVASLLFFDASMWFGPKTFCFTLSMLYMSGGSIWIMLPLLALEIFGIDHGGSLYGYVYPFLFIISYTGATLVWLFYDTIGYQGIIIICAAFTGYAIYLIKTFPPKHHFNFHDYYVQYEIQKLRREGIKRLKEDENQAQNQMEVEQNEGH